MTDEPVAAGEETPVAGEGGVPPGGEASSEEVRSKWRLHRILDHVWGPTGSVILHIVAIIALLTLFQYTTAVKEPEIEITVIEPDAKDLEEFKKELEQLQPTDTTIAAPDAEITMETEPETFQGPQPEDFAALDIKADVSSPLVMKGLYAGRSASGRASSLRKFAGRYADATERAVMRALEWLKEHQEPDGSWIGDGRAASKTAMTGMALLTFLAHGETPQSERYGPTVEKAIKFLVADATAEGSFKEVDGNWYGHGIASYALSEAYSLTRIPAVKDAMDRVIARIVQGQQPTGAFNYRIRNSDTRRDSSVMGWMTQALKAGYVAGADVPGLREALDKAAEGYFLNYDADNKMFAYAPGQGGEDKVNGRMSNTCMATLCLTLVGKHNDPRTQSGLDSMESMTCEWGGGEGAVGGHTLYAWYYATQAKFHRGKKTWENWNNMFARTLVSNQNADGSWVGFTGTEQSYGPVYGTCLSALSLMVYYRFLPTYQPVEVEEAPAEQGADEIKVEVI
jgi:hypothetical protein